MENDQFIEAAERDDETLADVVRELRVRRNLTQPGLEELTRQLPGLLYDNDRRVSQGHIGMIETGRRGASRDTVDALADAMGLDAFNRRRLESAARRFRGLHRSRVATDGVQFELSSPDPEKILNAQARVLGVVLTTKPLRQMTDDELTKLEAAVSAERHRREDRA